MIQMASNNIILQKQRFKLRNANQVILEKVKQNNFSTI